MAAAEFPSINAIRETLELSQKDLARLLGLSIRAVQAYEQGWRTPPPHVLKLIAALLLAGCGGAAKGGKPCWQIKQCPMAERRQCRAYRLKAGRFCWLVSGNCTIGGKGSAPAAKAPKCAECPVARSWLGGIA